MKALTSIKSFLVLIAMISSFNVATSTGAAIACPQGQYHSPACSNLSQCSSYCRNTGIPNQDVSCANCCVSSTCAVCIGSNSQKDGVVHDNTCASTPRSDDNDAHRQLGNLLFGTPKPTTVAPPTAASTIPSTTSTTSTTTTTTTPTTTTSPTTSTTTTRATTSTTKG